MGSRLLIVEQIEFAKTERAMQFDVVTLFPDMFRALTRLWDKLTNT